MMTPERCARISGSTCLQAMMAPRRLMVVMRSNAASVISVERRVAAGDAHTDIVVQDVDAAPALLRGVGHRRERRLLGDVGLERHAFSGRLPRHRDRFLGGGEVVVDGQNFGALLGKTHHGGAAIAHAFARRLAGADHDSDLVLETHVNVNLGCDGNQATA